MSSVCSIIRSAPRGCCHNLSAPNPVLITHSADLAVYKVDLDHVLGGFDEADGSVGAGIEDFGSVAAAFVGRDITIAALYIEGQPM
jgi:hypothetical protein